MVADRLAPESRSAGFCEEPADRQQECQRTKGRSTSNQLRGGVVELTILRILGL